MALRQSGGRSASRHLRRQKLGDRAAWFAADVTDAGALERAVAGTVGRFGALDVAIANAGIHLEAA